MKNNVANIQTSANNHLSYPVFSTIEDKPLFTKMPDRVIVIQAYDKDEKKRVITFSYDKHEWFGYENNYGVMMEKFIVQLHQIVRMDKTIVWYKTDGYRLMNGAYENCMDLYPKHI